MASSAGRSWFAAKTKNSTNWSIHIESSASERDMLERSRANPPHRHRRLQFPLKGTRVIGNADQAMAAGSAQVRTRVKLAQSQPQELARLVLPHQQLLDRMEQ
jgi:hypothetical protein